MVTKEELISERNLLAVWREKLTKIQEKKNQILAQVMSTPEFRDLLDDEKSLKEGIEQFDVQIRQEAVELYLADPTNKKIIPGVDIRETTTIQYDPMVAKSYAIKHMLFLKLDEKAFEKYTKDRVNEDAELDFVTISKVPSATIATDLTKFYLE